MKAEFKIDSKDIVNEIVSAVVKELKPLISDFKQEEEILFTVRSLAEYLSVSKQWVYERISLNEIPCYKIGKFPRFRKSAIDDWLSSHKIPAVSQLTSKLKVIK
tara:strand:- start:253 stop:564 length:312 start_codon:yes stop_codon:yes gene_type:complete